MGKAGIFFKGVKSGMVTMLNASGSALVSMYDTGAFAAGSVRAVMMPGERTRLERRIKEFETKILALQYEIGRESARYNDTTEVVEALELRANIARVKDCEREIEQMKQRLVEIEEEKLVAKAAKKARKAKKKPAEEPPQSTDRSAMAEALLVIPLEAEAIVAHEGEATPDQKEDAASNLSTADADTCPQHSSGT